MPELLSNILLQALTFGIGGIGVAVAFRVVRYPDLTADGSFMLGAAVFATSCTGPGHWIGAALLAAAAGAAAGFLTAVLNAALGVSRLLSGILTSMVAYSLTFRLQSDRPNIAIAPSDTMFTRITALDATTSMVVTAAVFALILCLLAWWLLRSELGLFLRVTGENPRLVSDLGRSPWVFRAVGLAVANGLVGVSGGLVSAQQGFADVNLGVGMIVTLIASMILGEEVVNRVPGARRFRLFLRVTSPLIGAGLYFALYLGVLRASIRGWLPIDVAPTDLKILGAALVVLVIALRRGDAAQDQALPL